MKKIISRSLLILVSCVFAVSCANNDTVENTPNINVNIGRYLRPIQNTLHENSEIPIVCSNEKATRAVTTLSPAATIYLKTPTAQPINLSKIVTVSDMASLVDECVEFSLNKEVGFQDSLNIDVEQVQKFAEPLLPQCKQWLYDHGFTESDIRNLLEEEGLESKDLIPMVLTLIEIEQKVSIETRANYNFQLTDAQIEFLKRSGYCAGMALGADILSAFQKSNTKVLSYYLLKKLLKHSVAYATGWAGIGIFLVSWGTCMGTLYHSSI